MHVRPSFVALDDTQGKRETSGIHLSVVVPAFNESERLPALLRSLEQHLDHDRVEIVVVDDGSSDTTAAVAQQGGQFARSLKVVTHPTNRGKGAAVRTGVLSASGALIAFVDADDATDLEALTPMCERIEGRIGAVFGSRHAPGAVVTGSPPIRGLMGRVFNHVVRIAAGTTIADTQCGAKVFRASVARAAFSGSTIDGFAFDVEILRRLMDLDIEVIEHPVRWRYVAGSKIRPLTPLRMLRDIARMRFTSGDAVGESVAARYESSLLEIAEPVLLPLPEPGAPCTVLVDESLIDAERLRKLLGERGLLA